MYEANGSVTSEDSASYSICLIEFIGCNYFLNVASVLLGRASAAFVAEDMCISLLLAGFFVFVFWGLVLKEVRHEGRANSFFGQACDM